ncbi:CTP synthetase [Yoonia sp.]|uniref:CTP synthetase n=1 Tax=Yoonia sp. TaxID=2212373 RepID=UPI00391C218C
MFRLATMLYSIIGTSFAGSFVIAALATGRDTLIPILIAAGAGALLGIPASWYVARAITKNIR